MHVRDYRIEQWKDHDFLTASRHELIVFLKMIFFPTRLSLLMGSRKTTSKVKLSMDSTNSNLRESYKFL